jgi:hypothetical protein
MHCTNPNGIVQDACQVPNAPYMDLNGTTGADDSSILSSNLTDDIPACKLKCMDNDACKGIVYETGPNNYKKCNLKSATGTHVTSWTNKNPKVTYTLYRKNIPA